VALFAASFAVPAPRARGEQATAMDYSDRVVVRAKVADQAQIEALENHGAIILNCAPGPGSLDVLVNTEQRALIQRMRIPFTVVHDDVNGWIQRERAVAAVAGGDPFSNYFLSYHEYGDFATEGTILWYMNELVSRYPTLASLVEIGQTLEGRTIWGLRITNDAITDKPAVVYFSAEHAREWITTMVTPYYATYLLEHYANDTAVRDLVDNVEFFIIPVFNVDGYIYSWTTDRFWRKNLRGTGGFVYGVDLNRNWGTGWGGPGSNDNVTSGTYRGPEAFSEPETQALRDFFENHTNIRAQLDIHNYSQLILWSNAGKSALSPDEALLDQIGTEMRSLIYDVHGKIYQAGATWDTLYPASGVSFDWTYHDLGILSMTIECRDKGFYGFVLPADQIVPQCEELLPALSYYANTPWVRSELPQPVVAAAGSRYLSIEPGDYPVDVAFRVTSPDLPCLLQHASAPGYLAVSATSLPGATWGTVAVGDAEILPETTYRVQAVYDGIGPTRPVAVTTGLLGDVRTPYGRVDFNDISDIVSLFLGDSTTPPLEWCDLMPSTPDRIVDFADIDRAVLTFRGARSTLPSPCP